MGSYWIYTCGVCGRRVQRSSAVLKCAACNSNICPQCYHSGVCPQCHSMLPPEGKTYLTKKLTQTKIIYWMSALILLFVVIYLFNLVKANSVTDEYNVTHLEGIYIMWFILAFMISILGAFTLLKSNAVIEDLNYHFIKRTVQKYMVGQSHPVVMPAVRCPKCNAYLNLNVPNCTKCGYLWIADIANLRPG